MRRTAGPNGRLEVSHAEERAWGEKRWRVVSDEWRVKKQKLETRNTKREQVQAINRRTCGRA